MRIHPAADVFPLMDGPEFEALVEDIRKNGLREPGKVDSDGVLLDGRNRLRACEAAGVPFETVPVDLNGSDAISYVVSLNVKRRNLSSSQRALAAVEAWEIIGPGSRDDPRARKLAQLFGTNQAYVSQARALVERDPDAAAAVKRGSLPLPDAHEALRKRERTLQTREEQLAHLREQHPELADRVETEVLTLEEARTLGLEREREEAQARQRLRHYMTDALAHLAWEGDINERAVWIAARIADHEELGPARWRSAAAVALAVAEHLEGEGA